MNRIPKREEPTGSLKERMSKGPLKPVRAKKVHNNKINQIGPRGGEPGV